MSHPNAHVDGMSTPRAEVIVAAQYAATIAALQHDPMWTRLGILADIEERETPDVCMARNAKTLYLETQTPCPAPRSAIEPSRGRQCAPHARVLRRIVNAYHRARFAARALGSGASSPRGGGRGQQISTADTPGQTAGSDFPHPTLTCVRARRVTLSGRR